MRIISFCADGIRDAAKRGFFTWAIEQDADIICVQDLRAAESALQGKTYNPDGYFAYFWDSIEGKQNGVSIYTRKLPKAIMTGLNLGEADGEGRFMQADFENISVASLLVPVFDPADPGSAARKARFLDQMKIQLDKVRKKRRQYILCGNWNMAHRERDVQNAANHADAPGFQQADRDWLTMLQDELGYVDAFRAVNGDDDEFSWWPGGRAAGDGWRCDTQIVSGGLRNVVEYGFIYKTTEFGAHAPVVMDYDWELDNL